MRGLSITLVFGGYAGFYISVGEMAGRICLGWVAVTIYWKTDIEAYIELLTKRSKE